VPSTIGNVPLPDFGKLSVNLARATEEGQKALAAYMKPIEEGQTNNEIATQVADCVNTLGQVAEHWLNDATARSKRRQSLRPASSISGARR
jgi:polyhydroxyalkanoate synthase